MEDEKHRVILHRIGENTEEEKARFCGEVSENYGIPLPLMRNIADRCPIVIKKDLPFKKAERLAIALQSFGASVSVERKRNVPPISIAFTGVQPPRVGLESSNLRKSPGGAWQVFGIVRNIFTEELFDIWALVQVFDEYGELITFEEIPLPISPLPPNESSPFKALIEKDLPLQKISIGFKTASGNLIPAMDKRERGEWVEVRIAELKKRPPLPRAEISDEALAQHKPLPSLAPSANEGIGDQEDMEKISMGISPSAGEEISFFSEEKIETRGEELALTFSEKEREAFEEDTEEKQNQLGFLEEEDRSQKIELPLAVEEGFEEEELHLDLSTDEPMEDATKIEPNFPSFKKEGAVAEERQASAESKNEEKQIFYPWLDDFKRAIEAYDQKNRDPFLHWFENLLAEGKLKDSYHALLTVLIYARFNQAPPSDTALENTQKVFPFSGQPDLSPEQIPPLKGEIFFPSDMWRDLYLRALPKLHEVSRQILEETRWNVSDLDRLIRIIPHMTARNSRWVIRVLHRWIPEVALDVSEIAIEMNDGLYRVASRLGVVNPLFDYYQGKHSMGDLKIQAFARAAFPDDPGIIEEPMTQLGANNEKGHCLPIQPRCQACPFESFCQKLFIDFDPSEKGMILQP